MQPKDEAKDIRLHDLNHRLQQQTYANIAIKPAKTPFIPSREKRRRLLHSFYTNN